MSRKGSIQESRQQRGWPAMLGALWLVSRLGDNSHGFASESPFLFTERWCVLSSSAVFLVCLLPETMWGFCSLFSSSTVSFPFDLSCGGSRDLWDSVCYVHKHLHKQPSPPFTSTEIWQGALLIGRPFMWFFTHTFNFFSGLNERFWHTPWVHMHSVIPLAVPLNSLC